MVNAQHSASEFAAGTSEAGATRDERLPFPQAAALIVALSLGLWACIGYGLSYLL